MALAWSQACCRAPPGPYRAAERRPPGITCQPHPRGPSHLPLLARSAHPTAIDASAAGTHPWLPRQQAQCALCKPPSPRLIICSSVTLNLAAAHPTSPNTFATTPPLRLIFGSVHPAAALELVYWLRRVGYGGAVYFDTFPVNEDPVRAPRRWSLLLTHTIITALVIISSAHKAGRYICPVRATLRMRRRFRLHSGGVCAARCSVARQARAGDTAV